MPDEVQALQRGKQFQRDRDEVDDLVEIARSRGTHEGLQLRKGQFNRIEVGTVGRQKTQPRAGVFDRGLHRGLCVHCQVVEDDHIAWAQGRYEDLLDIREERGVVDGPIEDGGRSEPVDAQAGDDGMRLPMAARGVISQPHAPRAPTVAAQEIRRDARFIDEDVGARIVERLRILPPAARGGDVRPALFVGVYGFF